MTNLLKTFKASARFVSVAAVAAAAVVGLTPAGAQAAPAAAQPFYVTTTTPSARALATAKDPAVRAALAKIASQPQAQWVGGNWVKTAVARSYVTRLTAGARAAGTVLPLVVYSIPHRDCGLYSSGGAAGAAAYRAWIDQIAAGIGAAKAMVILEPDALGQLDQAGCLTAQQKAERLGLLRYAAVRLQRQPHTQVYLDAGNALWQSPATMAARLRAAGIRNVRGFALNVGNTDTTASEATYGRAISALVGGSHFVIDTSRNGNGSLAHVWCNPAGRALGERPVMNPAGVAGADALLWVKTVGVSDGSCNGAPAAGTYMLGYAVGLATRAHW